MVPRPSIERTFSGKRLPAAAGGQTLGVRMQVGRAVALVFAGSVYQSAISGSVLYQWEDERGQVHYSDTVPDKYKRTARRIDTRNSDVPPEQVRAAQAQADALKARAAATASSGPSSRQLRTSVPGTHAAASRSSPNLGDCAAWRSAFLASRNCYAGFQTTHGPLKQGASAACGPEIPNPEPKCGAEK